MPHLTTAERIGMEKGIEALQRVISTIIKAKFGEPGRPLAERATQVENLASLEELSQKILAAQNISEAESFFHELELRLS